MSAFYYVTFKYVVIRDRRLGAAYYVLVAIVLLYAFIDIFWNKAYLQYDKSPLGTLRVMLKDSKDKELYLHSSRLPYCCHDDEQHSDLAGGCQSCLFFDAYDLSWPVEGRAITIATFVKERWETCQQLHGYEEEDQVPTACSAARERNFYTINPEATTIKVEHSFVASAFTDSHTGHERLALSSRQMEGWLFAANGTRLRRVSGDGRTDKLSLAELLKASGLDGTLDNVSDAVNAKNRSYRSRGVILRISLIYRNDHHFMLGTGPPEYSYHVRHVPFSDYRAHQLLHDVHSDEGGLASDQPFPTEHRRMVRKRYGVHIAFEQSGKLGMFSLVSLLSSVVSSVCLITIVPTVLDAVILYMLPGRSDYRDCVYEESRKRYGEGGVEAGVDGDDGENKEEEEGNVDDWAGVDNLLVARKPAKEQVDSDSKDRTSHVETVEGASQPVSDETKKSQ